MAARLVFMREARHASGEEHNPERGNSRHSRRQVAARRNLPSHFFIKRRALAAASHRGVEGERESERARERESERARVPLLRFHAKCMMGCAEYAGSMSFLYGIRLLAIRAYDVE